MISDRIKQLLSKTRSVRLKPGTIPALAETHFLPKEQIDRLVWIGLGTNQGDAQAIIKGAHQALQALSTHPLYLSPIYKTQPWGYTDQPPFYNQVIGLKPFLDQPEVLLDALQKIELEFNRQRLIRWGPRTLDLDLLAWPTLTWSSSNLTLPHPRLHLRRFVLIPWADLAPSFYVHGYQHTVQELMLSCPDSSILCCLYVTSL